MKHKETKEEIRRKRSDQIRREITMREIEKYAELPKSVRWAIQHKPYTG